MKTPEEKKVSRRGFLQSSTSAAVGGALLSQLGAPRVVSGKPNTETLRVGLVGCGGRGTGAAMNALQADGNVVLTAMGDLFADNLDRSLTILREKVPEKVRVDRGRRFTGLDAAEKLIGSREVDVVILATPPAFRPRQLAAAVEAGKHAFVEITAAVDAPGVRSVLASAEVARKKGLAIVSGFCWRYDPVIGEAIEPFQFLCKSPSTKTFIPPTTSRCNASSLTIPPFPTSSRRTSNCGLIRQTRFPPGFNTPKAGPRMSRNEMKDTSITTMSACSGKSSGSRCRALHCSRTTTRGSLRSFHTSWLVPTSIA